MRRLKKGSPVQAFKDCIRTDKPADWDAFSGGHRDVSQEVRLHILCEEQDSLCGYTELPIENPFKCEIDHFRKQDLFNALTFDWDNFVVATKDEVFGAKYKDNKSGITKAQYAQILNPVTDDAVHFFEYTVFGQIEPKHGLTKGEKALADKTIEVFNLTHESLRVRRYELIRMIEYYADFPAEDIQDFLKDLGFKSVVEQYINTR